MSIEARIPEAWRHPAFHDMRRRIETLEEENRQLRDLMKPAVVFPLAWGLTRREADLLAIVYGGQGCVRWAVIRAMFFELGDDRSKDVITVFLSKARPKLKAQGVTIETRHGVGLMLPAESRSIIDGALSAMAGRGG
ncbi:hypothetical protein [Methylobacterium sp. WL6]|uniref:hypothetical protein n=1 Tax=Methylobacterium sp. WL6 TaxID=2603901 RepID=UPI0011C7968D|nr:hypothetical protein [Methylobacterium sp. WL6]TXN71633.1 hypothetical protein FV230_07745 [Methylobacterium sp. WL6]